MGQARVAATGDDDWDAEPVVLLVEDEEEVRNFARTTLMGAGLWVLDAANAAEAAEVVRRFPRKIDLLVTDVVMPGANGLEVADRLAVGLPVLFISGFVEGERKERLEHRPRSAFLAKPFVAADLIRAVHNLLHSRQSEPSSGARLT